MVMICHVHAPKYLTFGRLFKTGAFPTPVVIMAMGLGKHGISKLI
jgi:hypothetical protein